MGQPLDGSAWVWELSCLAVHLSALEIGRTGVLPGRMLPALLWHPELHPLCPSVAALLTSMDLTNE